ncbi:MAG: hydrolase [Gammaproteobacteria bacterium]|nr:MAG: hydrolase [Gammaproteobacteria bacterium]
MKQLFGLCLTLSFFAPLSSVAAGRHLDDPIPSVPAGAKIDGVIADNEWDTALRVQLLNETHPSQNVPALVATEVLMQEDGENFYVAFIAEDPEPGKIRAFFRDRDSAWDDDFVGVVIDTFNDERRAFEFFVNPLGAQMDLIQDDITRREDSSWNAIWDSAGQITATGYVVEIKIPLKQLRFTGGLPMQTWGIDLLRFYPRDKRHRLSNNTSDYSVSCYLCQLDKVEGFANLESKTNLQLVPTVTSTYAQDRDFPFAAGWDDNFTAEAGMDVRWGITQDIYLNATYNPDFSQVEADVAQVDINNTFSLYYPERREFFLDGADYFNTQTNLVHTRNIAAPDFGAKLTGKYADHTLGLFLANDANTSFLIPGSQRSSVASLGEEESYNAAVRYRYDINAKTNVGLIGTGRLADDYHNLLIGVDGDIRLRDSDRISAQVIHTNSQYPLQIQTSYNQPRALAGHAAQLGYEHDDGVWNWNMRYTDIGEEFRADLGFINQANYRQGLIGGGHNWRYGPGSRFSRIGLGGDLDITFDQDGRELEREIEATVNAEGPWQSFMLLGGGLRRRSFENQYFDEYFLNFFGQMKPRAGVFIGLNLNGGNNIDFANARLGQILTIAPRANLFIGKHLQLGLQHSFQTMFINGATLYTTNLSDVRLTYQFNTRSFLRATIQYSQTEREAGLYRFPVEDRTRNLNLLLLYSYKINPQTRFFIGFSDSTMQNDTLDSLEETNRTVFTKVSYAWMY